jgi:hypothetical protein
MAKNVKKFSDLITESENKRSDIMEIINKLGYSSIEEIKKEKNILSKLEALLKELPGTQDVSEDEAEDIEDETKKKGEPKSLEDKEGEFEENSDSTSDGEVAEDAAEEIEDDTVKTGEPKELDDEEAEELQSDEEDVQEIPGSADVKGAGTEVPKKRILSFDEFVAGNPNPAGYPPPQGRSDDLDEEETTVNKNVNYRDDEEEEEDYAEPVAASVKTDKGENVNEAKINNAKEFEEYAMAILKSAHGEDFDEEIATKVVNDLKSKYGEDWGAMVGALQSGMGK